MAYSENMNFIAGIGQKSRTSFFEFLSRLIGYGI